jgi:uncharacterized protein YkwD
MLIAVCCLAAVACTAPKPTASQAQQSAARRMVHQVNRARARHHLFPLRASGSLVGSAQRFSRWLMRHGRFAHRSHVSASGRFRRLGEALAMSPGTRPQVGSTLRNWLSSPEHRVLVLTHTMREVGVGVARGRFQGRPATIWVFQVGQP